MTAFGAAVVALIMVTQTFGPASADTDWIIESPLYLEMDDGVLIEAALYRPDVAHQVPVIFSFGPYGTGSVSLNVAGLNPNYAYLFASVRGSGCSGGEFDLFSPRQARDGATIVDWAGSRTWSSGKVGMVGNSYLGIIQFFVAAEQPEHLAVISPFHIVGDIYRDVTYPGGIYNDAFPAFWGLYSQPQQSSASVQRRAGDPICAANQAGRPAGADDNAFPVSLTHPFDDEVYRLRSPLSVIDRVQVPVLIGQAWQDHQVGARGIEAFNALDVPAKKLVLTNGIHPTPKQVFKQTEARWLEHWLRGVDNGITAEPPVTVAFDTHAGRVPGFVRHYDAWPPPEMRYEPAYLRAGGALSPTPPTEPEAPASYAYPAGVANSRDPLAPGVDTWTAQTAGALTYLSEPFADETIMLGPWAMQLEASSTAVDTDFYVAAYDVAPDGGVTWLQKGLLRASHRALVPERSTPQHPYHPHDGIEPLAPGEAYRFDIEMLPIGHAFRPGHRLLVKIMAPHVAPELFWGYAPTPLPAVNTVHHSAEHPSVVWLPIVEPTEAFAAARGCGDLVGQPCYGGETDPGGADKSACGGQWVGEAACELQFRGAPVRVSAIAWGGSPISPGGPPNVTIELLDGDDVVLRCVDTTARIARCVQETSEVETVPVGAVLTCRVHGQTSSDAPYACSTG